MHHPHVILPIGWKEWVALPDLGLPAIKAKVDTGAKTSALHTATITEFTRDKHKWVEFEVHPLQRDNHCTVLCQARVIDERIVMNSGGHREMRYVIKTGMLLGSFRWDIELTLTQRHDMTFRMLLGREALCNRASIDPADAFLQGKLTSQKARRAYGLGAKGL